MLGVRSEEDVVHLGGEVVEDVAWSWCGGRGVIRHWCLRLGKFGFVLGGKGGIGGVGVGCERVVDLIT